MSVSRKPGCVCVVCSLVSWASYGLGLRCVCVHVWMGVHDGGCGTMTHKLGSLRKCTSVQGKMT